MFKFDLLPGESVKEIFRQTEAVLFKPVLIVFCLIYFPWYFLLTYDLATSYLRLLGFWTILVLLYAVYKFLLWRLNVYILSDRRLVVVSYLGLMEKKVSETHLDKILNVGFTSRGFWQAIFQFGNVEVQVPGLLNALVLKNISNPSKIKDALWQAHANFRSI